MTRAEFLDELRAIRLGGLDFTTLERSWLECLISGGMRERSRRVILCLRENKRDLDLLEAVTLKQVKDGKVLAGYTVHPLVAGARIGLSQADTEAIWRASVQAVSGWDPELRKQLLLACDLSPDRL